MDVAKEGMSSLQIIGIVLAIIIIGAGSVWFWLKPRKVERHPPDDPDDRKKPPR